MKDRKKVNSAFSLPELLNEYDKLYAEVEQLKSKQLNKTKLAALFSEAPIPLICLDGSCNAFFVNQQFLEVLGLDEAEVKGKSFCELIFNEEIKAEFETELKGLLQKETPVLKKKVSLKTSRGKIPFRIRARLVKYDDEIEYAAHIILEDISEEEKFKEAYRNLVENSFQAILIIQDFKISFANDVAAEISGYTVEELTNLDAEGVRNLIHPDDRDRMFGLMKQRLRGKRVSPKHEFKGIRKDGSVYWLEVLVSFLEYNSKPALQIVQIDISDKKQAETQITTVEHKYHTLIEQSIIGVYIITGGVFTYVNPKLASIFGYSISEMVGKMTPQDVVHPDDWPEVRDNLKKRIEGEIDSVHYEFRAVTKKGRMIFVEVHGSRTVLDDKPAVIGMLQDVTERKDNEEKLNLQSMALSSAANGIVITDKKGTIVYTNPAFTKLTGYLFDDVVGKNPSILKSGKHDKDFYDNIWNTILSGKVWEGEIINRRKDGSEYIEQQTITPVPGEDSEIEYFIAIKTDVTDSKITERALKESEQRLRNIIEHSNEMFYIHDTDHVLTYVSPQCEKMLGYSQDEMMVGWTTLVTDNPMNEEGVRKTEKAIKTGERQDEYLLELMTKNESKIIVQIMESPLKNSRGKVVGIAGALRDVTEKIFAERKLKESEERFRGLYENAILGIYRTSPEGKVLMANPALCRMLGFESADEMNDNKVPYNLYDKPGTHKLFREIINVNDELYGFETVARKKDGSTFYIRESARAVKDNDGNILYYEGIIEDIESQKLAEQKLIEAKEAAEKSDALKTDFLAQMSHEIRTPINAIQSFSSLIREEVRGLISNELLNSFSIIDNASHRVIRTIDLILNMSQLQTGSYRISKAELHLYQDVLLRVYPTLSRLAKEKNLKLEINADEELPTIYADDYSIHQIFDNLIHNAIKYTPKGKIEVGVFQNEKGQIVTEISDTGIGISEEYLPNLFKPFTQEEHGYTRKYEGNGLGLALVKRYCELNEIDIDVKSKKGVGTTFTLIFPNGNKE